MSKKVSGQQLVRMAFALLPEEKVKMQKYASSIGVTPSELARVAVRELILKLEEPTNEMTVEQTELAYRVRKMEDRMAALLAKLTRAAAQTLYFTTLPYMHGGLPKEPLPQGAVRALWGQSRQFAGEWLKKAQPEAEATVQEGEVIDSDSVDLDSEGGDQ